MTSDGIAATESAARFTVERFDDTSSLRPAKWFGAGHDDGSIYVVRDGDQTLWTVGIDFGDASHVPFREELFWEAMNTIVIGGGNVVYIFDTHCGKLKATISVPSLFGHLSLGTIPIATGSMKDVLFILGWTDVHAIDYHLETRWIARSSFVYCRRCIQNEVASRMRNVYLILDCTTWPI